MIPFREITKPDKKVWVRTVGKQNKGCIKPRLKKEARYIFYM